jgi:16S rRNA (guanine1207-N2)-methyltransferase
MASTPGDHYFSAQPQPTLRSTDVVVDVAGQRLHLTAAGGVFSARRLDPGTAVLLRKAELPDQASRGAYLDLGCGYGPIACSLAACAPNVQVYAVDVNRRALQLVAANAQRLGLADRVVAVTPDEVPDDVQFAQIWSNPPIRIGKGDLHALLDHWLARLAPQGRAWLVVARNLGGDSLAAWLTERGWSVQRHASQKGFRVLDLRRPVPPAPNSQDAGDTVAENA